MTQLRPDAAYIRTDSQTRRSAVTLSAFDEQVCKVFTSAHTLASATKALTSASPPAAARTADDKATDLESKVMASMIRLLEADRIELSPDS